MQHFRAPRWLPGGNLQTIWPALFSLAMLLVYSVVLGIVYAALNSWGE